MSIKVFEVPVAYTVQAWPQFHDFIEESLHHARGELTADEARVYVTQGLWTLIAVYGEDDEPIGALVVQYFNRLRDRVAFVVAMGGKLILHTETFAVFADILKHNGATCIEGGVRKSVARLLRRYGFEEKHRIVGHSL